MARWGLTFLVALLATAHLAAAARVLPSDKGLTDQKNYMSFGGVGTYAGVGPTGIPYGGVAGGLGTGGGVGGTPFNGIGGVIGTGPNGQVITGFNGLGGLGGLGGGAGGGGLGGLGGGAGGGGLGGGALPSP